MGKRELTKSLDAEGATNAVKGLGPSAHKMGIEGEKGFEIAANFDKFFDRADALEMSSPAYTASHDARGEQNYGKPAHAHADMALNCG